MPFFFFGIGHSGPSGPLGRVCETRRPCPSTALVQASSPRTYAIFWEVSPVLHTNGPPCLSTTPLVLCDILAHIRPLSTPGFMQSFSGAQGVP